MEVEIIYLDEIEANYIGQLERETLLKDWEKFATEHRKEYMHNPFFYKLMNRQRNAILMKRRDLLVWKW